MFGPIKCNILLKPLRPEYVQIFIVIFGYKQSEKLNREDGFTSLRKTSWPFSHEPISLRELFICQKSTGQTGVVVKRIPLLYIITTIKPDKSIYQWYVRQWRAIGKLQPTNMLACANSGKFVLSLQDSQRVFSFGSHVYVLKRPSPFVRYEGQVIVDFAQ